MSTITEHQPAHPTLHSDNEPVELWGLRLAPYTMAETLSEIERRIELGEPCFIITANVHYAMLSAADKRLQEVNRQAAFLLADGMPLVWVSRWKGPALPERVAGSDLVPALCERAAHRGFRVLFLGGAPGVAAKASESLRTRFPALQVTGLDGPCFRDLSPELDEELVAQVRQIKPDLLLLACSQPDGELWLAKNSKRLGVPVCLQVGATADFIAGRVRRSPHWLQCIGLVWAFRIYQEPRRLGPRYWQNARFLAASML